MREKTFESYRMEMYNIDVFNCQTGENFDA